MGLTTAGLYVNDDIKFVNTSLITESARHFLKHGFYTKAPRGSKEHKEFWDIEEDRILNGIHIPGCLYTDEEGNQRLQDVHITGKHYSYLNYGQILKVENLEDLDGVVKLTKKQTKAATKVVSFPDFWDGDYHWFTAKQWAEENGLNIIGMKARRKGFSYKEGFDAAITVNMNPFKTVLLTAYDFKYLNKGDQIFNMARNYLDFIELNTDFNRGFLKRTDENVTLGYKEEGTDIDAGFRSKILALSFGNNPDCAAGKDGFQIKVEEIGKAPNLLSFLDITLSTVEAGSLVTGMITMFGTGGTKDANWEAAEAVFYHPDKYNCLAFDNVWDDGSRGTSSGFFFPHIQNLEPFIDKDGNSDLIAAQKSSDENGEKQKTVAHDINSFNIWRGQRANKPSESFLRTTENIFSSIVLDEHIIKVQNNQLLKDIARNGRFLETQKGIVFLDNYNLKERGLSHLIHEPVQFPVQRGIDTSGCYVEWHAPYRDPATGLIPSNLYRVWNDPFAFDKNKEFISLKDSLGATFVYERANNFTPTRGDILIGAYIGRPSSLDEYNEQLLFTTLYCNGMCMFENDRGDVKPYFKRMKQLHRLVSEPDFNWKKELAATKSGRGYGVSIGSNLQRKGAGAVYLKDWLYTPRGFDENDNKIYNLHYINDLPTLRELQKWSLKGNFDRVSALIVGMFDIHELLDKMVGINSPQVLKQSNFFNRVFEKKSLIRR
jgi:hypothetical protein